MEIFKCVIHLTESTFIILCSIHTKENVIYMSVQRRELFSINNSNNRIHVDNCVISFSSVHLAIIPWTIPELT